MQLMTDLEIKALAYVLARKLKDTHHKMSAYQHVIDLAKGSGMPDLDQWVEIALQAPDIQAETDRALGFLDAMLPPIPDVDLETVQRLWLEKVESSGKKPN
jgi:hypothetical protein